MAEDNRNLGHYWVATNYRWVVAEWNGYCFKIPGSEDAWMEGDFRAIDEKEITRE